MKVILPVLVLAIIGVTSCNSQEREAKTKLEAESVAAQSRTGRVTFVFATPEEGAAALTADDEFTAQLQPREIGIRTLNPNRTSMDDFREVYGAGTVAWTDQDKARVSAVIDQYIDKLAEIDHILPERVYMTLANGTVAGGLPHTRGNTIVFSGGLPADDEHLGYLFLHELHHVFSRHNSAAHDAYYAIIGFKPCVIEIPQALNSVRLTNPDAPTNDHYVPVAGEEYDGLFPFLFTTGAYEPETETALSNYFGFGLLSVDEQDGICEVQNNLESLIQPNEVASYMDAIGRNTDYIIHPEETMADNFVFWATDKEGLPNPEIPAAIGAFWKSYQPVE